MDFSLSEEQKMLVGTIGDFIKRECPKEYIREMDEKEEFPYEPFKKMAQLGWLGLTFPEKYGGSNRDLMDVVLVIEELARGFMALAFAAGTNWLFAGDAICHFGTEEQKAYYLPKMTKGEIFFAFALTEPNAGSDALAIQTFAAQDGNHFILNGNKIFSTMAHVAQRILVIAKTEKKAPPQHAISIFIVDPKAPGVEMRRLKMLGRKSEGTAEIFLNDVKVSKEDLVGELNKGWNNIVKILEKERVCAGSLYTGGAQSVVDDALQYAKDRVQFGRPIGKFQAISHMLADMQRRVEEARLLTHYAAWKVTKGLPAAKEAAMAKLTAAEAWVQNATMGMQVMGGYGFMMEYDMQRHFRDSRPATYAGGSVQIMRNIIAREMGL